MPTHSEANRLNLEYYRKQAKQLLRAVKSGDRAAAERLARLTPRFDHGNSAGVALHDAQLVIAREQGFASWPRFKTFLEQSNLDFQASEENFVQAALSDFRRAEEMLMNRPEIAKAGLYPALVLGDVEKVENALRLTPELARMKGGPREWQSLLYVCFSRFAWRGSNRAAGLVATARALLRAGADPNASCIHAQWPESPLSCLYGATGLNNNPELGLALLEAGANPNDGESLYHSTEHPDLECMKLLLQHGASPNRANALKHILDREDREGVRLLLDAGADPNEQNPRGDTALHWAIFRGRSAETVAMLLDARVAIDVRRKDGRTAYALAVQSGQTEVARLLEARGANTELSPIDRFIGACERAEAGDLELLLAETPRIVPTPENERLLTDLAQSHRTSAVRGLLAAGMPVNSRDSGGATALHWACWKGFADLAKILLHQGASLTAQDNQFHATPAGWFGHGAQNCGDEGGDYAEVARVLIAAGVTIPLADMPTGRPEVDAVLREHGLIR